MSEFTNTGVVTKTLDECAAADMILLLGNDIIYKKRLVEEE